MPSKAFRWVSAYFGASLMAFLVYGVGYLLCAGIAGQLGKVLPIVAGLLVLAYMPRILYMMRLEYDVMEWQFYEDLELIQSESENGEEDGDDEDDDGDGSDFPLQGHDGKPIPKNFN